VLLRGAVAQLGEHLVCNQGVSGSIPLSSTLARKFSSKSSRKWRQSAVFWAFFFWYSLRCLSYLLVRRILLAAFDRKLPLSSTLPKSNAQTEAERLPRRLGLYSAVAVLVGSTIGSGIFRVPSTVATDVGSLGAITLIWILGAVVALFGALTLAELAAIFPRSGGIYVFLREAYGPLPAFLFGWTELLVIRPSALGGIAMVFATYAASVFGLGEPSVRWIAAGAIILLALANIRSSLFAAGVVNVTTTAKVIALIGIALIAFVFGNAATGALRSSGFSLQPNSWGGFGLALIAVMWTYDGWADLTFVAGEVKDPARTLPRALLLGTGLIIVLYLVVNFAYLYVLPINEMAGSKLVAADAARKIFGAAGASAMGAVVMLSAFGGLSGSTLTGPRILYAMADDGLFFKPIAWVHQKYQTPWLAIALTSALGAAYVSIRTFERLADDFILGIWPFYALAVGAVFVLRRRRADLPRPYRTAGYPLVPIVFLIASVLMLGNSLVKDTHSTLLDFGIILIGIPVYAVWSRGRTEKNG
jgi:APA family basic amino acid/polyamine antiporter